MVLRISPIGRGALVLALALAGCRRAPRDAVIGAWRSDAGQMQFYPDGKLYLTQADGSVSVAGYAFVAHDRMTVTALAAAPAEYAVRVTRDSLRMCRTDAPSSCYALARVPAGR